MNLLSLTLIKFSVLLAIVAVSILPDFNVIDFKIALSISAAISVLYFFVGYKLVLLKSSRLSGDYYRVNYLPYIVISKRIIFIFLFLIIAALLLAPETRVVWLVPSMIILSLGEIIFFAVSVSKKCFSVLFYPDHLFFLMDKEKKIFGKEVKHIEYRYENFYLVLFNNSTFMINPDFIPAKEKAAFRTQFLSWAHKNAIPFTEEATQKMAAEKI
ncbi:MAG: hypothetical protein IAF38_03675 [Bacteroidia bacterium]|nr:hypothetical protein [Bacteroidia bacterium]